MSRNLFKLLPVAAALALSGLAHAGVSNELPSVVVKFGDLDLNSEAGVARLHARLRRAAQRVCGPFDSRLLGLRDEYEQCVSDAVERGIEDVGNANLTSFHRYGRVIDVVAAK